MTTLTLQPDSTAGQDTYIQSANNTSNFDTNADMVCGSLSFFTASVSRMLIKFDLSSLPAGAAISSATLSFYLTSNFSDNTRTLRVYRQKRAWVKSQATWDIYSTGNNWQTSGAFGANDCESSDIGSLSIGSAATLNQFYNISLTPTTKAGLDLGNGWLVRMDTENSDAHFWTGSDGATAANRPKLVVIYTLPTGIIYPSRGDGLGRAFRGMDS